MAASLLAASPDKLIKCGGSEKAGRPGGGPPVPRKVVVERSVAENLDILENYDSNFLKWSWVSYFPITC